MRPMFFDFGKGLFPRSQSLVPLSEFMASRKLQPKPRFHDRDRHSRLVSMRPRKRRKIPAVNMAKHGASDIMKITCIRRAFGLRVPLSQMFLIGTVDTISEADLRQIEIDFFDGEQQPKVHIEIHLIRNNLRGLRIKHAKTLRLVVTLGGKDYPLVRAEDSSELSITFPLFIESS